MDTKTSSKMIFSLIEVSDHTNAKLAIRKPEDLQIAHKPANYCLFERRFIQEVI